MLQEFVPTEKLRGKSKSLISARRRAGAAEGSGMQRWLYLDLSAGFEANTQHPILHPQSLVLHLQPLFLHPQFPVLHPQPLILHPQLPSYTLSQTFQ